GLFGPGVATGRDRREDPCWDRTRAGRFRRAGLACPELLHQTRRDRNSDDCTLPGRRRLRLYRDRRRCPPPSQWASEVLSLTLIFLDRGTATFWRPRSEGALVS